MYGSTVRGIARGLGIHDSEAQQLIDMYFKEYPRIREYVNDTHTMARYNHFVFTPFGQRKQELGTLPPFEKSAVFNAALRNSQNVMIQSTASTLGLDSFASLNEAIKFTGARSLCTVYDSIEISSPIEHAAEVIELGFKYMDDVPVQKYDWLDYPIGCDAEIGISWGNLKEVHRGVTQDEINAIITAMENRAA